MVLCFVWLVATKTKTSADRARPVSRREKIMKIRVKSEVRLAVWVVAVLVAGVVLRLVGIEFALSERSTGLVAANASRRWRHAT